MIPVPGYSVSTPYGRRGSYWSCNPDAQGNGIHTGADYPAPTGTKVVAARPGRLVWCSHGSAFGFHQVEVVADDGTRDFYAHMSDRAPQGDVAGGDRVGAIGSEGNSTGPHLHFERHAVASGGWSCSIVRDPQPSIEWQPKEEDEMTEDDWKRMRTIVREEVTANNRAATDAVWDRRQDVTKPDGKTETKSMRQIVRETWQRVAKGL